MSDQIELLDKTARLLAADLREAHECIAIYAKDIQVLHARIAQIEALIADAPHGKDCPKSQRNAFTPLLRCNCFKSRALDTKEKSND